MMLRRFFEIVTRRGGANSVSLQSLPQIERARVITLFEEAKQLNSNSSPEKLQEMMGKLRAIETQYAPETAPEIWSAAHYYAQHIFSYMQKQSTSFKL